MTIKELRLFFNDHLVPEKLYSLNGNHKNRICLEKSMPADLRLELDPEGEYRLCGTGK